MDIEVKLVPKNVNQRRSESTISSNQTVKRYDRTHNIRTYSKSQSKGIDDFRAREEKREREYEQNDEANYKEVNDEKVEKFKTRILEAALPHVPKYSWTRDAIACGAESIGYPSVSHAIFKDGGIELIQYFYAKCNTQLIEQLQVESEKSTTIVPAEFVAKAIRMRLEMIQPYKATWPKALALMSLPANVPKSLAQLLTLVDDICYYSGDRSVDFGWYTRRVGLASIYKMTELYMIQDSSIDHQATWTFLNRRIDDGIQIQSVLSLSDEATKNMTKAMSSAFTTARNILGISFDRR